MLHSDKQPVLFFNEVGGNDEMRLKGIWLVTEIDNIEARALYKKLAARETKDIVVYDWDGAMDD
ncbi:MAG: hypothetical protein L3J33_13140 [Rhodobacteraceae bacterium]|nr:hypothetical protein [Paracoccaceae bacterium]